MSVGGAGRRPGHAGALELTWTDKDKALLSTGDGRYDYTFVDPSDYRVSEVRLLHEVESVSAPTPEDAVVVPTQDNLLITGDAMHALDALTKLPEFSERYLGKVKLVYIDPPFNTGQAFTHYEDNIEHSIWLTMLRDRLRQIKPLLSPDGSVWVHLDDAEVHRCRSVMDEELGAENFVAEVIWEKADSPNNSARYLSKDTDTILVYAGSKEQWRPNRLARDAASDAFYANPDEDPRGRWYPGDPYANKTYTLGLYEIVGPTGRTFRPPAGRFWRLSEERFQQLDEDGRIYWGPSGNARPSIKRFLSEVTGLTPRTLWKHMDVGSNRTSKNEIRALFPGEASFATPKPERLLARVLHIATDPGDVVLDCFAGSGTTAAVAHKMGRHWVTSELQAETVNQFTLSRLARVVMDDDPGGVTTLKDRVPVADLPDGVSPEEAAEFSRLLRKFAGTGGAYPVTIKTLLDAAKTRPSQTKLWHGGGSFTHLRVGPSMFEKVGDLVLLAPWATQGDLARAMCAQLSVPYQPDGIFAGSVGGTRYVVIDGMAGDGTVDAVLDQLLEGELVEIWATQVDPDAIERLRKARPGCRLAPIPAAVLDRYRHSAAVAKPFGGPSSRPESSDPDRARSDRASSDGEGARRG